MQYSQVHIHIETTNRMVFRCFRGSRRRRQGVQRVVTSRQAPRTSAAASHPLGCGGGIGVGDDHVDDAWVAHLKT